MRRILITGSNRGIGLALVQHYATNGDLVFATCRRPGSADELQQFASQHPDRVKVLQLDVIDAQSIAGCVDAVRQQTDGLDMLINNAGILPGGVDARDANISRLGDLEADAMLHVFRVNSISPVMMTQAFVGLLRNGTDARVINVSSDAGSITLRSRCCDYSYPASKAALNMMTRCLAGDLKPDEVAVVSVHPGFIKTDMGGVNDTLTLNEAIPTLVQTIDSISLEDTGQFFNWDGKKVDW
ncbi:MAG: SDR family oxidoreductase [Anaerolineaceae bacterium]|nr:SDR family oxidoreductase [Anaerolineae bacterium]MCB9461982.1 SDR family oxidoreductase [Anaerolineaceae bacterium]